MMPHTFPNPNIIQICFRFYTFLCCCAHFESWAFCTLYFGIFGAIFYFSRVNSNATLQIANSKDNEQEMRSQAENQIESKHKRKKNNTVLILIVKISMVQRPLNGNVSKCTGIQSIASNIFQSIDLNNIFQAYWMCMCVCVCIHIRTICMIYPGVYACPKKFVLKLINVSNLIFNLFHYRLRVLMPKLFAIRHLFENCDDNGSTTITRIRTRTRAPTTLAAATIFNLCIFLQPYFIECVKCTNNIVCWSIFNDINTLAKSSKIHLGQHMTFEFIGNESLHIETMVIRYCSVLTTAYTCTLPLSLFRSLSHTHSLSFSLCLSNARGHKHFDMHTSAAAAATSQEICSIYIFPHFNFIMQW